jgi:glycosyltransferase involved in cell wall biosynthesis
MPATRRFFSSATSGETTREGDGDDGSTRDGDGSTRDGDGSKTAADSGNGVTIGRVATLVALETGLAPILRTPAEILGDDDGTDDTTANAPLDANDRLTAFLDAADAEMLVVLHAFKCGAVLDAAAAAASSSRRPTVLVFGGTDVNVDAAMGDGAKCRDLRRRVAAADRVVAFSRAMVDAAAPALGRDDAAPWRAKIAVIPQGVALPEEAEEGSKSGEERGFVGESESLRGESESLRGESESLRGVLGVSANTPVFLLPAGLRPVKDVLWAAAALERAADPGTQCATRTRSGDSHVSQSSPEPFVGALEPLFVVAVMGPSLDASYAAEVRAFADESARSRLGAFRLLPARDRATTLRFMRESAGVLNTSASEGQSGALLEAAACGVAIVARDVPGNRALLRLLAEATEEEEDGKARGLPAAAADPSEPPKSSSGEGGTYARAGRVGAHACGTLCDAPEAFAEAVKALAVSAEGFRRGPDRDGDRGDYGEYSYGDGDVYGDGDGVDGDSVAEDDELLSRANGDGTDPKALGARVVLASVRAAAERARIGARRLAERERRDWGALAREMLSGEGGGAVRD